MSPESGRHVGMSQGDPRAVIAKRLRERRSEIERAVATRVYAVSKPSEAADPVYVQGLRAALSDALDFAFVALELGERRVPEVPPSLLTQARMAARNRIGLDTVLRRYAAGYTLFGDLIFEEAAEEPMLPQPALRRLLRDQAAIFDRVIEAVSEEYKRESDCFIKSSRQRREERVQRLLAGEAIDATELDYNFSAFHLGLVGAHDVEPSVRELASVLGLRLLCILVGSGQLWGWLGSQQSGDPPNCEHAAEIAEELVPRNMSLALGVPGEGIHGWTLTHHQAMAAFAVANLQRSPVTRYSDVCLLACVSKDELLRESLDQIYMQPLAEEPDGGEILKCTLRAYFASGRQISSTAAALRASRQTIGKRLKAVEARLGRPLEMCVGELEIALRYADLLHAAD